MKVSELIEFLSKCPQSVEICINYRISRSINYREEWLNQCVYSEARRIDPDKIYIIDVFRDDCGYVCGTQYIPIYEDSQWHKNNSIISKPIPDKPDKDGLTYTRMVLVDMIDTPKQLDYNGER